MKANTVLRKIAEWDWIGMGENFNSAKSTLNAMLGSETSRCSCVMKIRNFQFAMAALLNAECNEKKNDIKWANINFEKSVMHTTANCEARS